MFTASGTSMPMYLELSLGGHPLGDSVISRLTERVRRDYNFRGTEPGFNICYILVNIRLSLSLTPP